MILTDIDILRHPCLSHGRCGDAEDGQTNKELDRKPQSTVTGCLPLHITPPSLACVGSQVEWGIRN